ncbi:MAG: quinone-dependent dihydroorotate dehydrogenase [Leptonema sp. (in: bacteria)]
MFYKLLSKILFNFEPEKSHQIVTNILKYLNALPLENVIQLTFHYTSDRLKQNLWDIDFPNILGLAAGFDKTGELYPILSNFGFGFIECGTFTPQPQIGNPKPRLFRYQDKKALVNRMGFNNPGIDKAKEIFKSQKKTIPRGINIGRNKTTSNEKSIEDYINCFEVLYPFSDYMVINVSSPNTTGLRDLQTSKEVLQLIKIIQKKKKELQISLPILVKISPDLTEKQFYFILERFANSGIDGVILTNTTTRRDGDLSNLESGGLSGLPLKEISTNWICKAYKFLGKQIPIIGVGGIFNGKDALEKIMCGASLVQIYTGYVYEGPLLPKRILFYIDSFLERENCNITDIVGIGRNYIKKL